MLNSLKFNTSSRPFTYDAGEAIDFSGSRAIALQNQNPITHVEPLIIKNLVPPKKISGDCGFGCCCDRSVTLEPSITYCASEAITVGVDDVPVAPSKAVDRFGF